MKFTDEEMKEIIEDAAEKSCKEQQRYIKIADHYLKCWKPFIVDSNGEIDTFKLAERLWKLRKKVREEVLSIIYGTSLSGIARRTLNKKVNKYFQ